MSKPVFALSLWSVVCQLMRKTMNLIHLWKKVKGSEYFPNELYVVARHYSVLSSSLHTEEHDKTIYGTIVKWGHLGNFPPS